MNGIWTEGVKIQDGSDQGQFGISVSVYQQTMAVGAVKDDNVGAVYVYDRPGTDGWTQVSKLVNPRVTTGNTFGYSVTLHSSTLVVGASSTEVPLNEPGGC